MVMWHNQDLLDMDRVGMELVYGTQQVMIHNGRSVSVSMDGGEGRPPVLKPSELILNQSSILLKIAEHSHISN